jgi:hypothetical protein
MRSRVPAQCSGAYCDCSMRALPCLERTPWGAPRRRNHVDCGSRSMPDRSPADRSVSPGVRRCRAVVLRVSAGAYQYGRGDLAANLIVIPPAMEGETGDDGRQSHSISGLGMGIETARRLGGAGRRSRRAALQRASDVDGCAIPAGTRGLSRDRTALLDGEHARSLATALAAPLPKELQHAEHLPFRWQPSALGTH